MNTIVLNDELLLNGFTQSHSVVIRELDAKYAH